MYKGEASNGYIKKRIQGERQYVYFQYYDLETRKPISIYCGIGDKGVLEAKSKRIKYLQDKQRLLDEKTLEAQRLTQREILELKEEIVALKQEIDIADKIHKLDSKKPSGTLDDYMGS